LKLTLAVSFLSLLAAGCLLLSCAAPQENALAIVHVTVVDMAGAAPRPDQDVIVKTQRIAAVGPSGSIAVPRGARIVDGRGKFLIPGLADMHVHLTAAGEPDGSRSFLIPLLLAHGITTVRDMGGYLESLVPLRREVQNGKRPGPQIVYAGPYLDGSPPSFEPSLVVRNAEQADQAVRQLAGRGVDFIKVQSMLSRDAYFAIARSARREHLPFAGHVPDRVTAAEAADAGQRSIEHLTNVLRGCSNDEKRLIEEQFYVPHKTVTAAAAHDRVLAWQREMLDSYSQPAADALADKFVAKEVWQTPTLVLLQQNAFPTAPVAARRDERERYIPAATLAIWRKVRAEQMRFLTQAESALRERLRAKSASLVGQMQRRGVRILAGTDSPAPYVFPGSALHDELALLVEAGLTPREALESATRNAAEFLGTTENVGTVTPGKFADLVLLDADPLEDIRNTERIRAVVLRGRLLDREALDGLLAGELRFASGP